MEALRRAFLLLWAAARTLLRGFGWTFVVLVLLCGGLFWYAQRALQPEKARVILVDQLQALLNREVNVERVVLTPRGIKVRGLRVRRGRRGSAEDLLVCDSALVTLKLKPLLHRRLELDAVRLDAPRIYLNRDESGVWDLADLFTSSAAARRSALPFDLAAAETRIENGMLRLDDRLRGRKVLLEGFALRLDDFALDKPFPLSTSFASEVTFGTRTVTTSVSAEGTILLAGLAWSSATARADRLTAVVNGTTFAGDARMDGFGKPRVTFTVTASPMGQAEWRRDFGKEWPLSVPAVRWSGTVSFPELGRWEVERLEARTPVGRASAEGTVLLSGSSSTLRGSVRVEEAALEPISAWHPDWARRELKGKADLRLSVTGWFGRLQAEGGELALRGFGARFGAGLAKKVEGLDATGWAADEFAVARATVTKGKVTAYENVFDELTLGLSLRNQNLVLERSSARWGGSTLKLRGRVERLSAPKEVLLSGSLDKLVWDDAQRLVLAFKASFSTRTAAADAEKPWVRIFKYAIPRHFPDTAGHVRIGEVAQENFYCREVDLLWSLRGVTPSLDAVGGEARVRLNSGRVRNIPAVQDAHKLLRVLFLPFIFMNKMNKFSVLSTAKAFPLELDFNRIEGEYAVARGVATTRYFYVDSPQMVAYAEGDADFGREKVDMNILTRLTHVDGILPEWWVDELGRPAIGFRVKGDLSKPDPEPRFNKIGSDEIEKKVEEGQTRAKKRFEAIEKLKTL